MWALEEGISVSCDFMLCDLDQVELSVVLSVKEIIMPSYYCSKA